MAHCLTASQQAQDIELTSHRYRYGVTSLHRCQCHVITTSCVSWDITRWFNNDSDQTAQTACRYVRLLIPQRAHTWIHLYNSHHFLKRETSFVTSCLFPWSKSPQVFREGILRLKKRILILKQILSYTN